MLDCNEVLTLVSFELDESTRCNKRVLQHIKNASWKALNQWGEQDKKLVSHDVINVRIHVGCGEAVKISKGDILIRGIVNSVDGMTTGQILNQYEAITVQSVSYNLNARPYSRHIRVKGK